MLPDPKSLLIFNLIVLRLPLRHGFGHPAWESQIVRYIYPMKLTLPILCLLALSSTALHAVIISVNFQGRGSTDNPATAAGAPIPAGSPAGVMNVSNFNNISAAQFSPGGAATTFTSPALNSSTGAATAITFNMTAADSWNSESGNATPNAILLNGIIKANANQLTVPLNILGLTPGNTYTLDLYTTNNGPGGIQPDTRYTATNGVSTFHQGAQPGTAHLATPGFILGTNTVAGTYPRANYVEFKGVVGPSGAINLNYTWIAGISDGAGISGFQLNVVPEPTSMGLMGLGFLLAARRRRR